MKIQERITKTVVEVTGIRCDACDKLYDGNSDPLGLERQEFLSYSDQAGYGSIFGDENHLSLDMCQHCVKVHLGKFLVVKSPTHFNEDEMVDGINWVGEDYI